MSKKKIAFVSVGTIDVIATLFQLSSKTQATVFAVAVAFYFIIGAVRLLCYYFYAKKDASILKLFIATRTQQEFEEYKQDVQRQCYIAAKEAERETALKQTSWRC